MEDLEKIEKSLHGILSLVENIALRMKRQEAGIVQRSFSGDRESHESDSKEKISIADIPVTSTDPLSSNQAHNRKWFMSNHSKPPQQDIKNPLESLVTKLMIRPLPIPTKSSGTPPPPEISGNIVGEVFLDFVKDLGNAWIIPEDKRVPLAFSKQSLLRIPPSVQDQVSYSTELKRRIEKICDYNCRLLTSGGSPILGWRRRFQIFDCYPQSDEAYPTYHTYKLTSEGSRRPFYIRPGNDFHLSEPPPVQSRNGPWRREFRLSEPPPVQAMKAPWRRIVLCQGASTMERTANELQAFEPCEFFEGSWFSFLHGYRHHLELSQESTSHEFKYFEDERERCELLFQLIYFDYVEEKGHSEHEAWPHGTLYRIKNSGVDLPFRKAAFTIFVRKGAENESDTPMTIVIYSASNLYKKSETVVTAQDMGLFSPLVTIFSILLQASWTIGLSWKRLERIMHKLVSQDEDSFMNPEEYVSLMYDDATFTRSRLYFWAIGALSEFENSLAEYINQLELFHRANIETLLRESAHQDKSSARIRELHKEFREHVEELNSIRRSFKVKLIRVQGLQDALFTGSSVMEARQSRVLGENVQLLTFVSIFFLPLGFATGLWSVPAVSSKFPNNDAIIYATCIIGGFSYFIIFNLKRLISTCQQLFAVPVKALGREDERFPKPEDLPRSKWWLLMAFFAKFSSLIPKETRWELKRTFGLKHLKRVCQEMWRWLVLQWVVGIRSRLVERGMAHSGTRNLGDDLTGLRQSDLSCDVDMVRGEAV